MTTIPSFVLPNKCLHSNESLYVNGTNIVLVHSLVLFSILDHHTRRPEGTNRVIGTLLGRREGDGLVEVTNCFAVPHAEEGNAEQGYDVSIGKDFNSQMLVLHRRTNQSEKIVGWYATTPRHDTTNDTNIMSGTNDSSTSMTVNGSHVVAVTSVPLHEFYADECEQEPIHLVVDTSLILDSIPLYAFRSTCVSIQGELVGNVFHSVRLSLKSSESEKNAIDAMIQSQKRSKIQTSSSVEKLSNNEDISNVSQELCASMGKLLSLIDITSTYVDQVQSGEIRGDNIIGRKIADAISCLPRIHPEEFEKTFTSTLQDLLMVTYLTDITKTQIGIAEKINALLDTNVKKGLTGTGRD